MAQTTQYAAIIDAGSGGTRPFIYSWPKWELGNGNPPPTLKQEFIGKKVKRGIHDMDPKEAPELLASLFQELSDKITDELPVCREKVPLYILATAGVRDLGAAELSKLLDTLEKSYKSLPRDRRSGDLKESASKIHNFIFPMRPEAEKRVNDLLQNDIENFATIHNKIIDKIESALSASFWYQGDTSLVQCLKKAKEYISSIPGMFPLLSEDIVEIRKTLLGTGAGIAGYLLEKHHLLIYEQIQSAYENISETGFELPDVDTMSIDSEAFFNPYLITKQIKESGISEIHPRLEVNSWIMQLLPIIKHIRKLIPGDKRQYCTWEDIDDLQEALASISGLENIPDGWDDNISEAFIDFFIAMGSRDVLFDNIREYAEKMSFRVKECGPITGEEEGLYGWIAASYLRGNLCSHGPKTYHTAGYVEMGGASAQIAFQPTSKEKSTYAGTLWRVEVGGKAFDMYLKTLPLGSRKSKDHHDNEIKKNQRNKGPQAPRLQDPCDVRDFHTEGDKKFANCEKAALTTLLNLWRPYEYKMPLNYPTGFRYKDINSIEDADFLEGAMEIDFQNKNREFIGGATFWDVRQETFGKEGEVYGPWEFLQEAHNSYVDVADLGVKNQLPEGGKTLGYANWAWFCAGFVQSILHRGFGFPKQYGTGGREFTFQPYGGVGMDLTWTIGRILLLATNSNAPVETSCEESLKDDETASRGEWTPGMPVYEEGGKIYLVEKYIKGRTDGSGKQVKMGRRRTGKPWTLRPRRGGQREGAGSTKVEDVKEEDNSNTA